MAIHTRIEMLGGLRVIQGESVIDRFQTQKTAILLAFLAANKGKKFQREVIAEMLWPDGAMTTIRNRLNQAVSSLRRQLHPPGAEQDYLIQADYSTVSVRGDVCETDVELFVNLLEDARKSAILPEREQLLGGAAGLGGEFLSGYYDEWVLTERAKLSEQLYECLSELIKSNAAAGRIAPAIDYARKRLEIDQFDERSHRALMRLYLLSNNPRMAIAQYEALDRLYSSEGLDPSARAEKLLAQARDAAQQAPSHSILEIEPAQADSFLKSEEQDSAEPTRKIRINSTGSIQNPTLPRYPSTYFGREKDIETVVNAIRDGQRLIAVTGVGGVGKTRFVVEVAKQLEAMREAPIIFVSFAGVETEEQLTRAFTAAVGSTLERVPHTLDEVISLLDDLGESVIVLDNVENVAEQAMSETIMRLLETSGQQVLVTSRRVLALPGELTVALPMLPVPKLEPFTTLADLMKNPAIALFVHRARATKHDFQLTERTATNMITLCQRLEGWPLAIELAAGWARTLSLSQMMDHLGTNFDVLSSRRKDLPERHQSLRVVLEQSFNLLTPELQEALMRLSIAVGGFDHETAEALGVGADTLAVLQSLEESSWISPSLEVGEPRYHILDAIRKFLTDKISPELREETINKFCETYVALLEPFARSASAYPGLQHAQPNCLLVISELLQRDDDVGAIIVAAAVITSQPLYSWGPHLRKLFELVRDRLDSVAAIEPLLVARIRVGLAHYVLEVFPEANWSEHVEKAIAYFQESGNDLELCRALIEVGSHYIRSDVNLALNTFKKTVEIAERGGHLLEASRGHHGLANCYSNVEQYDAALEAALKSAELASVVRNPYRHVAALTCLAGVYLYTERFEEAYVLAREAETVWNEFPTGSTSLGMVIRLQLATSEFMTDRRQSAVNRMYRNLVTMIDSPYYVGFAFAEAVWQLANYGRFRLVARLTGYMNAHEMLQSPFKITSRKLFHDKAIEMAVIGMGELEFRLAEKAAEHLESRSLIEEVMAERNAILESF
ncbi:MAG: BTAD domain-containing putative transcriptional regulator [Fimbriimonadaceae bacterium]